MTTRRDFIEKLGSGTCAVLVLGGLATLESCSATKPFMTLDAGVATASIPVAAFKNKTIQFIARQGKENIMVKKLGEKNYVALPLKCTHKGGKLNVKGDQLVCVLHGANFDHAGKVKKGPAKRDLVSFPVTVKNENVTITFR